MALALASQRPNGAQQPIQLDEIVLASHLLAGDRLGAPVHAEVIEVMQAIMRPSTALVGAPAA